MQWRCGHVVVLLALALACSRNRSPSGLDPADASPGDAGGAGAPGAPISGEAGNATGAEVVYQISPHRPLPLEADETHLYWGEAGEPSRIVRAPKTGGGTIQEVGVWGGTEITKQLLVVDATHVFWLDGDVIRKVAKVSGEASVIAIGAPPLAGGWVLIADDSTLYFSDRDCQSVARVAKAGGDPVSFTVKDHDQAWGGTWLAVDADSLYCGSGRDLLRFPKAGGASTNVAVVPDGQGVGPLVAAGNELYWASNRANLGTREENLAVMAKAGGEIGDLGNIGSGSAIMRLDATRNTLYWTTKGGWKYDRVLSFAIAERKLTIMAEGSAVYGGMAEDDRYVYWAGQTSVMRLAK